MPFPIRRIQTNDDELNRIQDGVFPPLNALLSIPILDGRLVETETVNGQEIAIVIPAGPKNIEHKLGRKYRGWIVVDNDTVGGTLSVDPPVGGVDPNPDPTRFLRLTSPAVITSVKLWIF